MKIKVGILISYDYAYALRCIEQVYSAADSITLAIDERCRTWNGEIFQIDTSFFDAIQKIDTRNIISVYRDNFYVPDMSAIENDTRERNMLAERMGKDDGWHVQVDADEYFIDFPAFVDYLHTIESAVRGRKVTVMADWITLFKKDEHGYYVVVSGDGNRVPIATNYPSYNNARVSYHPEMIAVPCTHPVLHESWSRSEVEISQKIKSWGHNVDFDTNGYLEFWRSVNPYNAPYIKDFHPLPWQRQAWHALDFTAGGLDELIARYLSQQNTVRNIRQNKRFLKKALSLSNRYRRMARKIYREIFGDDK